MRLYAKIIPNTSWLFDVSAQKYIIDETTSFVFPYFIDNEGYAFHMREQYTGEYTKLNENTYIWRNILMFITEEEFLSMNRNCNLDSLNFALDLIDTNESDNIALGNEIYKQQLR